MRAEFFSGVDEHGCVDGVALSTLADEFGTPLYVYRAAPLTRTVLSSRWRCIMR